LLWVGSLLLVLALASFAGDPQAAGALAPTDGAPSPITGPNWIGVVGESAARGLVGLIGVVSWAIPLELALLGVPFVRQQKSRITPSRLGGDFLIVIVAASMVQVAAPKWQAFGRYGASGMVGELFGELLRSLFSGPGSLLVGSALLGLILIGRATFSFIALLQWIVRFAQNAYAALLHAAARVSEAWQRARELHRERREAERQAELPRIHDEEHDDVHGGLPHANEPDFGDEEPAPSSEDPDALNAQFPPSTSKIVTKALPPVRTPAAAALAGRRKGKEPKLAVDAPMSRSGQDETTDVPPDVELPEAIWDAKAGEDVADALVQPKAPVRRRTSKPKATPREEETLAKANATESSTESTPEAPQALAETQPADAEDEVEDDVQAEPSAGAVAPSPVDNAESAKSKRARSSKEPAGPTIVDTSAALKKERAAKKDKLVPASGEGFRLPPIDFLEVGKVDPQLSVDREVLYKNAELLVKTLADYGVSGKVEEILPGPTVTTYEVSPAAGTKVSKVASLADDLALALARKVRIIAPIPGKNRIGFELPNERRAAVTLRDLVEDQRFRALNVPLPVVLGRDIVGNPVYTDLAAMPHVIVAGATGAGKSVGLNVMLTSLLYQRTPDELRMLMIDPKVVELAPFDRIPHMLLPVVTDMKQASNALKWAVDEMERRYQLFADAGTKNITTYNGWVDKVARGEARNPLPKTVVAKDHNGLPEEIRPEEGEEGEQKLPERMPFIVIVVDEFADLMMQQGKDVEAAIARLAQKARAAGMHVILATQRPSVDVITGMIKANFPTRIAFRVAQKVDSRTILDEQGAEHLLGRGDMLIRLNGTNETRRVQCPWVSEDEVQRVTDFLRLQGEPVYDENILKPRDDEGGVVDEEDAEQDVMYDDAVRIVAETRRCSTSWLQRKLGLGYNRAARIVEMMEKRGIVGPANGAKDREVLISAA
jgi:S-DNA-T family DNA segregation ATPase FtsK/SpoIIIE